MAESDFEFDVAFSFHSLDEGLATQLNDLLQDRFKTFIYSERQAMLAGTDGEETFNSVYGRRARFVVVFYRNEWGETPFTRIEQTAIRNRAFEQGFDFSIFVPTGKPANAPPWLPKTRLWFGLDRFGLKGLAAVVEARIQELGGEPRIESVADRAARLQRKMDLDQAKKQFRESDVGVDAAKAAFEQMTAALEQSVSEIASGRLAGLQFKKVNDYWTLKGLGPWLVVSWWQRYTNSLDGSPMNVELYDGVPRLPGIMAFDEANRLRSLEFEYHLIAQDRHGYIKNGDRDRSYSAQELAEHLLKLYFDAAEKHKRR
jgi:hypothetical protein